MARGNGLAIVVGCFFAGACSTAPPDVIETARTNATVELVEARPANDAELVLTRDSYWDLRSGRSVPRDRRSEDLATVDGPTVFFEYGGTLFARELFPRTERWSARLPDDLLAEAIALGGALVYVDGHGEELAAFDQRTGKKVFELHSVGHLIGEWAVGGPWGLLVPSRDGPESTLLVSPTGEVIKLPSPTPPNPLDLNDAKEPQRVWVHAVTTTSYGPCVGYLQGDNTAVQCFGPRGEPRWVSSWHWGESGVTPSRSRLAATTEYLVLSTDGNPNYRYEQRSDVLRARDGSPVGEPRKEVVTPIEDAEGGLSLLYRSGGEIHLERDGSRRWSLPYDQSGSGVIVAERVGGDLILAEFPHSAGVGIAAELEVVCLDVGTGVVRWRRPLSLSSERQDARQREALRFHVAGKNLGVIVGKDHAKMALLKLDTGEVLIGPSF